MNRANVWRSRLDVTTNWAIVTTAAFLSFGFGRAEVPHFVVIFASIFVLFFLVIEARRYKYFDLWRWRVALVNENFFATVFSPMRTPLQANWRDLLSHDLQESHFKITFMEAFGRRLRRNYIWIFLVLSVCWLTKVAIHPTPASDVLEILNRSAIYHLIPGYLVIGVGVVFNSSLLLIAVVTRKERDEVVKIYPTAKSTAHMANF